MTAKVSSWMVKGYFFFYDFLLSKQDFFVAFLGECGMIWDGNELEMLFLWIENL